MRSLPVLLSISVAVLAAVPRVASATPFFPGKIQGDLSLSYAPPCTICHQTNGGGTGTVTRAFGMAMKTKGLMDADTMSLATALTALGTAGTDSDCNGTPDIKQLEDGHDPNTGETIDGTAKAPATSPGCKNTGVNPGYGCGAPPAQAQLAAGPTPWQGAAGIATIACLALIRGRGRRRPARA